MALWRLLFPQQSLYRVSSILSTIASTTSTVAYNKTFRHPKLNDDEMFKGCCLGIDTWADTCCVGRHAFVEEFVEGKIVNAQGFSSSLGKIKNLPIAHVLYAYDLPDSSVVIIECNNSIYLGNDMDDSLINPIQCEDHGVRVDVRPRAFYPNEERAQSIFFDDGTEIPIKYSGVLPYISVRRPTHEEVASCRHLSLTSKYNWDPFMLDGTFSRVSTDPSSELYLDNYVDSMDPVGTNLMSLQLSSVLSMQQLLFNEDQDSGEETTYSTIAKVQSTRHQAISPEQLCKILHIGLGTAKRTLEATTHECIRTTGALTKRFKTDRSQLRYKQLMKGYGTFYCDFLKCNVESIRGYTGGVVFTNKVGFKKFFPCSSETGEETGRSLKQFIELVGLPSSLHSDNHRNFKEGFFKRMLRKFGIWATYTEPHSPWQNRAEPAIGEIKSYSRRIMQMTNTPIRLWCYCYEYSADVLSLLATGRFELKGRTPYEVVLNYTPDISEYVSFAWFQWCWYFNEGTKEKELCRWLGPAHHVGQSFCSHILRSTGKVIARSSVIVVPPEDLESLEVKSLMTKFMENVESKIGNHKTGIFNMNDPQAVYFEAFDEAPDADDNDEPFDEELIDIKHQEIDDAYLDSLDNYINAKVVIPGRDAVPVLATVRNRKRDAAGNPIGTSHSNPILDTRIYELEFPDGRVEEYSLNVIVENLVAQTDDDGWDTGVFDEIMDFRVDDKVAVPQEKGYITSYNGQRKPVITTKGVDVKIRWKDQSTSWVPLAIIKESHPVQVAEAAYAHSLNKLPAFNWWVHRVLKNRDYLISKLKSHVVRKGRMKFGIEIPGTVEQALELDKRNGNTLWFDAITKEMENSRVAFDLLARGEPPPVGFTEITCHLVFDLKLDMTRKARYVAGGHLTDVPTSMTYSTVVSRDTVRIGFLIAALNDLDLLAGDIQNAFLSAPTKEKIFFYAGDEWKSDKDKVVVVVRALYGLKSSALQFRNHLASTLGNHLGFKSSLADPDLWYKPETSPQGFKYYSYVMVYVDDILIVSKDPSRYMKQIQEDFTLKPSSIGVPKSYLGADISKVYHSDGSYSWTMGSETYVKKVISNIKRRLESEGLRFNKKLSDPAVSAPQPFSSVSYRPELDTSVACSPEQVTLYQNLIGVLRWVIELGRIDIAFEVSLLSRYLVQPRTGHLAQALHIIKYLDIHSSNELVFDAALHDIADPSIVEDRVNAMKALYPDATEDMPTNAPGPRGNPVQINCFVDSDHAGDRLTRRSQSGILIYCNSAPIIWYSKRQSTVESSTFGAEFVALRIATELIISLRYKLRMFGIPIMGHANVFCDNESVYNNVSFAESTLKKKHNSICFHKVRECVASGILFVHKVGSSFNLSDMLTKSLPAKERVAMRSRIMFDG